MVNINTLLSFYLLLMFLVTQSPYNQSHKYPTCNQRKAVHICIRPFLNAGELRQSKWVGFDDSDKTVLPTNISGRNCTETLEGMVFRLHALTGEQIWPVNSALSNKPLDEKQSSSITWMRVFNWTILRDKRKYIVNLRLAVMGEWRYPMCVYVYTCVYYVTG